MHITTFPTLYFGYQNSICSNHENGTNKQQNTNKTQITSRDI